MFFFRHVFWEIRDTSPKRHTRVNGKLLNTTSELIQVEPSLDSKVPTECCGARTADKVSHCVHKLEPSCT